jgi:hypothetical protein
MGDINQSSWLIENSYGFVMDVVTWVEAVTHCFRHVNVLSIFTFGLLRSFCFFGTFAELGRLHSSLKLSLLNICLFSF